MTSLAWFARHEARLAGRDLVSFLTGNRRRRLSTALVSLVAVEVLLHAVAWGAVSGLPLPSGDVARPVLLIVTGMGFLSWTLMLAQAMETVARVLYGRADLELVLSSPAPLAGLFALRTGMTALGTTTMALFLLAPVINMAALAHGPRWLAAYGVLFALGAFAAAVAIVLTLTLFRLIGPRRTRWVSQVLAAVIGAGFVIVAQGAGIVAYGSASRFAILSSPALLAAAPDADSPFWWPARAAMGDMGALAAVMAAAFAAFAATTALAGRRFSALAVRAAGSAAPTATARRRSARFSSASPISQLRAKELRLIARDPWLISQTLMQILYLLPPGLMLWINFGREVDVPLVLVPIVVMAAGQLAGGLAWLTISGEDAPDLVATAPITPAAAIRAKVEAVLLGVALPVAPLVLATAWSDGRTGLIAAVSVLAAAASATIIQFLFRTTARRADFRRRQTASRVATFAEAFSSIAWAAAGGVAAAGSWIAGVPVAVAALVLVIAWAASPRRG